MDQDDLKKIDEIKEEIITEVKGLKSEHRLDKYIIPIVVLIITAAVNLFFYKVQTKDIAQQEESRKKGLLKAQSIYDFKKEIKTSLKETDNAFEEFCFIADPDNVETLRQKLAKGQDVIEYWESDIEDTTLIKLLKEYQTFIAVTWSKQNKLTQTELEKSYRASKSKKKEINLALKKYLE